MQEPAASTEGLTMKPDQVAEVFNSTSTEFAELSPVLWDPIGAATVKAAGIRQGDRVLDICCGAGASAIPAAQAAGPDGHVDAIDLAAALLTHGRRRAAAHGLRNVRFVEADATTWTPDTPYDAAVCVHGVYFLPDMDRSVDRLTTLLAPGGRFAVTTWSQSALEAYGDVFRAAVGHVRGAAVPSASVDPSVTRIRTGDGLATWLTERDLKDVEVTEIPLSVPLTPGMAWLLVNGTGYRAMLTGLDATEITEVQAALLSGLLAAKVEEFDASFLVGVGTV